MEGTKNLTKKILDNKKENIFGVCFKTSKLTNKIQPLKNSVEKNM